MPRVTIIVGARPQIVKLAALYHAAQEFPSLRLRIVHTGQQRDAAMCDELFADLQLPLPDCWLTTPAGTPVQQLAAMLPALETELDQHPPDLVLVVGDTTSTLAGALAAKLVALPLAHVEAGLRSHDPGMPEEYNRRVTDALADYCFASEPSGIEHLTREGVPAERRFLAGNVMIDTLLRVRKQSSGVLQKFELRTRAYLLGTFHRPSNVDDAAGLARLHAVLSRAARQAPVLLPLHPRTRERLRAYGQLDFWENTPGLRLLPPLRYPVFIELLEHAALILTDSGGVQEESAFLNVPCLTFRANTERPLTVEAGTNVLLPDLDPDQAAQLIGAAVAGRWKKRGELPCWDGQAARRVWASLGRCAPSG